MIQPSSTDKAREVKRLKQAAEIIDHDTEIELRNQLIKIRSLRELLEKKQSMEDPTAYGLPDMFFPKDEDESDEAFYERRCEAVKDCVEGNLYMIDAGERHPIKLIPEMTVLLTDLFYNYESFAVLWKPRGGGGSVMGSIIIWLKMIYWKMSFINIAGSGEQAKVIYDNVKQFWYCKPKIQQELLAGEPMVSETRLTTGVILKCIPASEKQVRSKHLPGLIIDEACQNQSTTDDIILAGMQGCMNKEEAMILMLSTFHWPVGLFQEHWDHAEEKGFKKYKWDIYDVMEPCVEGLDLATEDDPLAIHTHCNLHCPLTEEVDDIDEMGEVIGQKRIGCQGKARKSVGFMTFKQVNRAKKTNVGTQTFFIEYEGNRPMWSAPIYAPELIDVAVVPSMLTSKPGMALSLGIDWGLIGQTSLVLTGMYENDGYAGVLEGAFYSGKMTSQIIDVCMKMQEKHGPFVVYADASHPFNNMELGESGFEVVEVPFIKWKPFGIENCVRYFANRKIKIPQELAVLLQQLRGFKRDKFGKPVKKDDHGPDALMCSMMNFWYTDFFSDGIYASPSDRLVDNVVTFFPGWKPDTDDEEKDEDE